MPTGWVRVTNPNPKQERILFNLTEWHETVRWETGEQAYYFKYSDNAYLEYLLQRLDQGAE